MLYNILSKIYNFQNPTIREKASQKAVAAKRPRVYRTRRRRIEEVKKELIKEELLKEGFMLQVGAVLPQINGALIKNASNPHTGATDRRTVYTILGLLKKEDKTNEQPTMGQLIADLFADSNSREN